MDEQTFQWMMGLGLCGLGAMMLYLHSQTMKILGGRIDKTDSKIDASEKSLVARIDASDKRLTDRIDELDKRLTARIEGVEKSLGARIDKLDEKLTDVDRRLCRIEGAMSTCCALNHDQNRKAE